VSDIEPKPKKRCGFAAMSPEKVAEIAGMGGRAAHAMGRAHTFSGEEAREAGRKGGLARASEGRSARGEDVVTSILQHPADYQKLAEQSQRVLDAVNALGPCSSARRACASSRRCAPMPSRCSARRTRRRSRSSAGTAAMSGIRRIKETRAGYDCIAKPCGKDSCGKFPGASHGRHGDEWHYTVTDGQTALTLVVFTSRLGDGRLPGPLSSLSSYPMGAGLGLHTPYPRTEDQIRNGDVGEPCGYLDGGRCYSNDGSITAASDFVKAHGSDAFEQSEAFWLALEAKWTEWRRDAEENRPRVVRCTCCNGNGVLPEETTR
jgi:general stress protein YciG